MALLRLVAEGVGPFDRLDLDLSDGKGNPHLGPHILAGVNGSGKSTILRALAWIFDHGERGFPYEDWLHLIAGHRISRSLAIVKTPPGHVYAMACTNADPALLPRRPAGVPDHAKVLYPEYADEPELFKQPGLLKQWVESEIDPRLNVELPKTAFAAPVYNSLWVGLLPAPLQIVAYAPSHSLRYIHGPVQSTVPNARLNSLAFENTVQNDMTQSWLLGLYSRRAIAREQKLPTEEYTRSLERFEQALARLYDGSVSFHCELKPFEPRLRVRGRSLNFSQIPDGIRASVGWIADYMMRQEASGGMPGVLLLDEIDAHLHPLWQRKLLPAMREALPDVQIIVTTHSPFVISSCLGARVHVLDVDEHGKAFNRPPVDSPVGESVTTTLKEIFGVDSRFDVRTEIELNEWNSLKRTEAAGRITRPESDRLVELTRILSDRSEELKSIVASPLTIPDSVLESLAAVTRKKRKTG